MNRDRASPSLVEPRPARASSRTSGEGPAIRPAGIAARPRAGQARPTVGAAALLRHNLAAPEKKTLKRIEALRNALARGVDDEGHTLSADSVGARICEHLKVDRGIAGHIHGEGYAVLASRLIDPARLSTPAATVVGEWLRETGGIERGTVTPERIKAALQVLNDVLYEHDDPRAPIPASVRELRIEKRDGGLQIVALLRHGARDEVAAAALRHELVRAGFADIVIRTQAPVPPATTKPGMQLR